MYRFVFFDIDDTLLDFGAAERVAYGATLREMGVEPTEAVLACYRRINVDCWQRFERGELDRDTLFLQRHQRLFRALGLERSAEECERIYRRRLGEGHFFIDGAPEILDRLAALGCCLYIASNGLARTQYSRLESAGIVPCFHGIFISEEVGFHKPDPRFFAACFDRIPGFRRQQALMVGDSLTSDIQGAKNAGVAACWFNPGGKAAPPELQPDFEIRRLGELERIAGSHTPEGE